MAFDEIIVYKQDDTVCVKVNPEYAFAGCESLREIDIKSGELIALEAFLKTTHIRMHPDAKWLSFDQNEDGNHNFEYTENFDN